jgi:hypothetical protein
MLSNLLWWPWAQMGLATPGGVEYHPVGDSTPALPLADLSFPVRRSRRRRRDAIHGEEEILISVLMDDL